MASTYAPCSSCGKLNRVDLDESAKKEPICGSCKSPLPLHFGVAEVSGTGLKTLSEKSPLPVICDFWAAWCGPCKAFAPVFQQAALRFAGKAVFAKLNTEQHALASDAFRIRSIPTLILLHKGLEKDRLSGALPSEAFIQWLSERLDA
jgi:thioredoxin 2